MPPATPLLIPLTIPRQIPPTIPPVISPLVPRMSLPANWQRPAWSLPPKTAGKRQIPVLNGHWRSFYDSSRPPKPCPICTSVATALDSWRRRSVSGEVGKNLNFACWESPTFLALFLPCYLVAIVFVSGYEIVSGDTPVVSSAFAWKPLAAVSCLLSWIWKSVCRMQWFCFEWCFLCDRTLVNSVVFCCRWGG